MSIESNDLSKLVGVVKVAFNTNDTFTITVKQSLITEKITGKYSLKIVLEDDASLEKSEYTISIKLGYKPYEEPEVIETDETEKCDQNSTNGTSCDKANETISEPEAIATTAINDQPL